MSKQITVYNFFYDQTSLLTCHLLFITSMLKDKITFMLKFFNLGVLCLRALIYKLLGLADKGNWEST